MAQPLYPIPPRPGVRKVAMSQDTSLEGRLSRIAGSNVVDEHYYILNSFIIVPMLPRLIEERGVLHKSTCYYHNHEQRGCIVRGDIYKIDLDFERDKRRGFWNWLARGFCPWVTGITIKYEDSLFDCIYFDYRYFQYAEDIKKEYDEKLRDRYGVNMVVVGKT
jgi:hypothetical protein